MSRILRLSAALFFSLVHSMIGTAQSVEDQVALVKEALIRNICREVYWYDTKYRLGLSLPLEVKHEGNKFYAWLQDLEVGKELRVAYFYEGRIKDGKGAVTFLNGHNLAVDGGQPAQFFTQRRNFEKDAVESVLTTPANCPLQFDPSTPEKAKMVETVVRTMEKDIRSSPFSYPDEVTITIADFNVDYPHTYVLIDRPKAVEMIVVYLHDMDDWDSDKYEREGKYPVVSRRIGPEHRRLISKIREHGIVRKITTNAK